MEVVLRSVLLQVPETAEDKELVGAAQGIMQASAQKFKLTYLSCKRDISTLLALSAIQVGCRNSLFATAGCSADV